MRVIEPGSFRDVGEAVVAVIQKHPAGSAIPFLVKDIQMSRLLALVKFMGLQ